MKNNPDDLKAYGHRAVDILAQYLSDSQNSKVSVLKQEQPHKIAEELNVTQLLQTGMKDPQALATFLGAYLDNTQHLHHPHYLGHQVAVPHVAAGISDLLHGVINNPMAIYEMGPAGATLERVVINWMLQKMGWLQSDNILSMDYELNGADGVLTHGGSLANLTALLGARAKADPSAWTDGNDPRLVILAPAVSHYCISRSASIMGMGSKAIRPIAVDKNEVMDVEALRKTYQAAMDQGQKIMAVVANACATATGLYDPLDEIGQFCNEQQLWYHVDGAHGASALLVDTYADKLRGIKRADSMIWDAHKMLRTSSLCAAVLVKDYRRLHQTFKQKGSYIFFDKEAAGFDVIGQSIECTKAPMGTKLFMVLAAEGEKGIADYIRYTYELASTFYEVIRSRPDFECPYKPESNILCFRYTPAKGEAAQLKIRNALTNQGQFYITSTLMNGEWYLRVSLMNDLTTKAHLVALLDQIVVLAST